MRLNLYTDYSLCVLLYRGMHQGRRVTMAEVAECYDISHEHLRKIIHLLGKLDYIETYRGKSGERIDRIAAIVAVVTNSEALK